MVMRRGLLILTAVLVGREIAQSCSCTSNPPPCQRFSSADVVFLGLVTEVPGTISLMSDRTKFNVEEVFSGLPQQQTEVVVSSGVGTSCAAGYKKGNRYVIFANRTKSGLSSWECAGSFNVADRDHPKVAAIRAQAAGKTATRIYGKIVENAEGPSTFEKQSPLEGVTVIAENEAGRYTATTNENGEYEIAPVAPGKYRIRAAAPGYRSRRPEYATEVAKAGCSELGLGLWNNPILSGQILDGTRTPVAGADVQLDEQFGAQTEFSTTDLDGRFYFYSAPPGSYYLGVNVTRGPDPQQPFPQTFFPGTTSRQRATLVAVQEIGSSVSYDFRLSRLSVRKVRIRVVHPDGHPLEDVPLTQSEFPWNRYPQGLRSDPAGEISFDALQELTYRMRLDTVDYKANQNMTANIDILPGSNDIDTTVVVKVSPIRPR